MARLEASIDTLTAGGTEVPAVLVPLVGVTPSHDPPAGSVLLFAVQFKSPCPELITAKLWASGAPPWKTALNVKPVCESKSFRVIALTVMVTGTFTVPAPPAAIVIAPL